MSRKKNSKCWFHKWMYTHPENRICGRCGRMEIWWSAGGSTGGSSWWREVHFDEYMKWHEDPVEHMKRKKRALSEPERQKQKALNFLNKSYGERMRILKKWREKNPKDKWIWEEPKKQSLNNHAPDKIGGTDEGKKGQARAEKEGDELPES